MYRGKSIAVVMPVHDEQAQIERAIKRVPHFVDLIVAVDDGSTDATWSVLSQIPDGRLARLRHLRNRGVGAATKTGYLYCLNAQSDLIAVMDGDGQMDGRDLARLLERAVDGIEYAKGNRFLNPESIRCMPRLRYAGNRLFSWLTRRAASFDDNLDAHCGYTVIQRQALRCLPLDELYDRYGFPAEMFFAACRAGLAIESVPVRTVYRDEVSGINPFTVVPAILYLIARNYVRRRFSAAAEMAFDPGWRTPINKPVQASLGGRPSLLEHTTIFRRGVREGTPVQVECTSSSLQSNLTGY